MDFISNNRSLDKHLDNHLRLLCSTFPNKLEQSPMSEISDPAFIVFREAIKYRLQYLCEPQEKNIGAIHNARARHLGDIWDRRFGDVREDASNPLCNLLKSYATCWIWMERSTWAINCVQGPVNSSSSSRKETSNIFT